MEARWHALDEIAARQGATDEKRREAVEQKVAVVSPSAVVQ
jgi:hypothetical protein